MTLALKSGPLAQAGAPIDPLPEIPRRLRIGMPQLDLRGLSESWLLRHAGDLCWEQIARQTASASHEICDDGGERLYPTFVAVRARYSAPLAAVRENDLLEAAVEVLPAGRACAQGRLSAQAGPVGIAATLLSTFARRDPQGALRMALPAARLAGRFRADAPAPTLACLARAARRGEPYPDPFCGEALARRGPALASARYTPSPYVDYNGAGLLYFAAYPAIADTVERTLVNRLGLSPRPEVDWALATSVVRRDVFYYRNLPLGQAIEVELCAFEADREGIKTHLRLRAPGGEPMADLIARKLFV